MTTQPSDPGQVSRAGDQVRPGFTLVELLVAIAAVALLAVGLAQIFSLTGRTVSAGRRLSNITSYANLLERQLRADLGSLTREGFLVIRNELTRPNRLVQRFPDDTSPRQVRVDELQFFAKGDFRTIRPTVNPTRVASAGAARIYYGHGLQQPTEIGSRPIRLDDDNSDAPFFGELGDNPNRYASNWTLVRHVTLLRQPSNTTESVVRYTGSGPQLAEEEPRERDGPWQIAQQPSVADLFRTLALGLNPPAAAEARRAGVRPAFSSGVVDIAATDLSAIRSVILTARPVDPNYQTATQFPSGTAQTVLNVHALMRDSLPADSDAGQRIRTAASPPNYLGVGPGWTGPATADQRADQYTLAGSAFLPRCTEFIVEWSFGVTTPSGGSPGQVASADRTVWHGLRRQINLTGGPGLDEIVLPFGEVNPQPEVQPRFDPARDLSFINRIPQMSRLSGTAWTLVPFAGVTSPFYNAQTRTLQVAYQPRRAAGEPLAAVLRNVDAGLINPETPGPDRDRVQYSYFGYVDPTYSLDLNEPNVLRSELLVDVNRNGRYDADQGDVIRSPENLPWPWPTMLRITVTLADPADPRIEQTFQFILRLPPVGESGEF
ncbi:MAG: prepilin-type N-terminal cleavage/methylation domain-containing protein [Planctomycetaceae bacterium]|nr:prepilin-type N-terminal cleavage/methylation domain-containing protein [Planctomycetaceae bacterium]